MYTVHTTLINMYVYTCIQENGCVRGGRGKRKEESVRTDGVQGHVAEAREELADGRLARARLPYQEHGLGVREAAADEAVKCVGVGVGVGELEGGKRGGGERSVDRRQASGRWIR